MHSTATAPAGISCSASIGRKTHTEWLTIPHVAGSQTDEHQRWRVSDSRPYSLEYTYMNRFSGPVKSQWDVVLRDHVVQGIVNEAGVPFVVPEEYGHVKILFKAGDDLLERWESAPHDEASVREELPDLVVAGYASPQVIDKEKHLITKEALRADLPRFLAHPHYRNAMIVHTNIQVGEVLPEWTHPETGEVYKTKVDDIGLFCVVRIRTDQFRPAIVDQVIKDIEDEKLRAFSVSGDAPYESRKYQCNDGTCFWVITKIELYEITICQEGINQDAKYTILSKAVHCQDGVCPVRLPQGYVTKATIRRAVAHAEEGHTVGNHQGAESATRLVKHDTPKSKHKDHDPRYKGGREKAFGKLTHQQKLEAGKVSQIDGEMQKELADFMPSREHTFEDPGEVLNTTAWTAIADNLDQHLDQHLKYLPEDANRRLKRAMHQQLRLFHEAKIDASPRDLDAYFTKAVNVVAYQEVNSWRRQLGDHGVRHITEDMELADEILGTLEHVSPEDRLLASVSLLFHDIGYTAEAARESLAGTKYHQQYSAEYVRDSKEIGAIFSPEQVERMSDWVATHDSSQINWTEDPVGSAIRLSDNLALFAREKLPALFRYVPGAVRELKKMGQSLAAGETVQIKKSKASLRKQVEKARLSGPMKQNLLGAVDRIFEKSSKYTLGMLAGERMAPQFDGQTMHIPIRFSGYAKTLQSLFDLGQEQFVKLAESYGMTREDAERGQFTFKNEQGEPVLSVKAVGATEELFKHLPGKHDQQRHGRRNGSQSTDPATPTHAKAMQETTKHLKEMSEFIGGSRLKPENWKYGMVEELLMEEGNQYTDEAFTEEEEGELLRLFDRLGTCKAKECYGNAMRIAMEADLLGIDGSYAEGIAHSGLFPMNHAFFVLNGKPVDLTWGRTKEGEDPLTSSKRRDRVTNAKKLLERAKENLKSNAYIGVEIPLKQILKLVVEREYYGSVFEVYGDSEFPLLKRDGVPSDWKQSKGGKMEKQVQPGPPKDEGIRGPDQPALGQGRTGNMQGGNEGAEVQERAGGGSVRAADDYEDPTDELDYLGLHNTPDSPHKEHDPRYGRGKRKDGGEDLPSTVQEAQKKRKALIEKLGPRTLHGDDNSDTDEFFSTDRLSAKVNRLVFHERGLIVQGLLKDSSGTNVGGFTRTLNYNGVVSQNSFSLFEKHQKKGYGTEFKQATHRRYAEEGFHSVELNAAEQGRYVWARMDYGFLTPDDLGNYKQKFRAFLRRKAKDLEITDEAHNDLTELKESVEGFETPRDFSETPYGKEFMLSSTAPVWGGFKVLNEDLWEKERGDAFTRHQQSSIKGKRSKQDKTMSSAEDELFAAKRGHEEGDDEHQRAVAFLWQHGGAYLGNAERSRAADLKLKEGRIHLTLRALKSRQASSVYSADQINEAVRLALTHVGKSAFLDQKIHPELKQSSQSTPGTGGFHMGDHSKQVGQGARHTRSRSGTVSDPQFDEIQLPTAAPENRQAPPTVEQQRCQHGCAVGELTVETMQDMLESGELVVPKKKGKEDSKEDKAEGNLDMLARPYGGPHSDEVAGLHAEVAEHEPYGSIQRRRDQPGETESEEHYLNKAVDTATVVICVALGPEGKPVAGKREDRKHGDTFEFPGGHVQAGEPLARAAERELLEESGVKGKAIRKLGEKKSPSDGVPVIFIQLEVMGGEPTDSNELTDVAYCDLDEVDWAFDDSKEMVNVALGGALDKNDTGEWHTHPPDFEEVHKHKDKRGTTEHHRKQYHATSLENAQRILKVGLQHGVGQANFSTSQKGKVYLTSDPMEAAYYGYMAQKPGGSGRFVVLEVNLTDEQIDKLEEDPAATKPSITFTLADNIGPENIGGMVELPGQREGEYKDVDDFTSIYEEKLAALGSEKIAATEGGISYIPVSSEVAAKFTGGFNKHQSAKDHTHSEGFVWEETLGIRKGPQSIGGVDIPARNADDEEFANDEERVSDPRDLGVSDPSDTSITEKAGDGAAGMTILHEPLVQTNDLGVTKKAASCPLCRSVGFLSKALDSRIWRSTADENLRLATRFTLATLQQGVSSMLHKDGTWFALAGDVAPQGIIHKGWVVDVPVLVSQVGKHSLDIGLTDLWTEGYSLRNQLDRFRPVRGKDAYNMLEEIIARLFEVREEIDGLDTAVRDRYSGIVSDMLALLTDYQVREDLGGFNPIQDPFGSPSAKEEHEEELEEERETATDKVDLGGLVRKGYGFGWYGSAQRVLVRAFTALRQLGEKELPEDAGIALEAILEDIGTLKTQLGVTEEMEKAGTLHEEAAGDIELEILKEVAGDTEGDVAEADEHLDDVGRPEETLVKDGATNEPKDELQDAEQQVHPTNVQVMVGAPSYTAKFVDLRDGEGSVLATLEDGELHIDEDEIRRTLEGKGAGGLHTVED